MNKKNISTVNDNEKKLHTERLEPSGEEKKEDIIKGKI